MKSAPFWMVFASLLTAQQPPDVLIAAPTENVQFVRSEIGWEGQTVRNSPYAADAVTETVQTLPDGNRITHKNSQAIARDSEGRTRREQSIEAIGPWAGKAHKTVFIHDPVAGVDYFLEPESKVARKISVPKPETARTMAKKFGAEGTFEMMLPPPAAGAVGVQRFEFRGTAGYAFMEGGEPGKSTSLGKQNIEGVIAEGTRTVQTIPAGQIGNDKPIEIVSERWFSPELQAVVMTRRTDPRMGETTYKMINIRQGEPERSLFEPPADYTVKDDSEGLRWKMDQMKKQEAEQQQKKRE